MSNPYVLMWLESPIQSWGYDSRFGRRDTLLFPTKSGVLGIICNALGREGEQSDFLSEFIELDIQVYAFPRSVDGMIKNLPMLKDFHMVGSGYDDKDPWELLHIPKTSEGKKVVGGGSKMTYRYYLQDMAFAVLLEIPSKRVSEIIESLQFPVYDLCLGRKCCVPTEFVYQGVFDVADEGVSVATKLATSKSRKLHFVVTEGGGEGEQLTISDVPIRFGSYKQYQDRIVTIRYE
ncbi:type I-E CRISPR-associated protein Cas5/CasD [Vibrio campbellii]|uniref:type I-E CRISPR-associated protein Cas5/CasD n=1 Tax=Vibrio campbellii TaxID=680 RepID=UPI000CD3732C|nr:type I-E CRISPR-associated protein Cas5/CasD [Vibrio campbellii]AUW07376.1 type I-E CRISPR-associated protein Cas5/CasD [Vibrio campbellii]